MKQDEGMVGKMLLINNKVSFHKLPSKEYKGQENLTSDQECLIVRTYPFKRVCHVLYTVTRVWILFV